MANSGGRSLATVTVAMSDFVLEVWFEKEKGERGDLVLYRAAETKDGLRPGLGLRLENKNRASSVLAVDIIMRPYFPNGWTDE